MEPTADRKLKLSMATQNRNNRACENLGFDEAIAEYIAPILTAHAFACIETSPYVVRFESADVTLAISHDRLSYEIEVAIARNADPRRQYGLGHVMNLVLDPGRKQEVFFQASTPERVVECVKAIGDLLEKFGHEVLTGDPATYSRIDEVARLRGKAFTKEVVRKPVRTAAEKARQSHDYAKVRSLFESIEADLTPSGAKEVEICQESLTATEAVKSGALEIRRVVEL